MDAHPQAITPVAAADLLKRIQSFLHRQYLPALRHLEVEVSGDTAVIQGKVRTYYERQIGVECCKRVAEVRKVIDLIKVATPAERQVADHLSVDQADLEYAREGLVS